jgi:hypothetical protein
MQNSDAVWRNRDGRDWRIGCQSDVRWITENTGGGRAITSAIPSLFEAYSTLELPLGEDRGLFGRPSRHEEALVSVLQAHTDLQAWWLGFLRSGSGDVVIADAPTVTLYAGWPYVLVEADLEHARLWRGHKGYMADLFFPTDRSCLVSTLWDDDWSCIGGSRQLIEAILSDPVLGGRARRVDSLVEDATPPGHTAF